MAINKQEEKEKAETQFQMVAEAYEVLSDTEKRGKYDRGEEVSCNSLMLSRYHVVTFCLVDIRASWCCTYSQARSLETRSRLTSSCVLL